MSQRLLKKVDTVKKILTWQAFKNVNSRSCCWPHSIELTKFNGDDPCCTSSDNKLPILLPVKKREMSFIKLNLHVLIITIFVWTQTGLIVSVCPSADVSIFHSKITEQTLTKFGMDVMPLEAIRNSCFYILQSVTPTWRTNEHVRWERQ
jgi:hypothetical protein